jgi:hypothetical protein
MSDYDSPYEDYNGSLRAKPYITPRSNRKSRSVKKLSIYQTDDSPKFRPKKEKIKWTDKETEILRKGMETFGCDWSAIHAYYSRELKNRTPVNLKDRARNVKSHLVRTDQPLGIWVLATNYTKDKKSKD